MRPTNGVALDPVRLDVPDGAPGPSTTERYRDIARKTAIADALCLAIAAVLAFWGRFGIEVAGPFLFEFVVVVAAAPLVGVAVFRAFNLYLPQALAAEEEFRRTVSATSVTVVLIALVSYWSKASFSRLWIAGTWVLALVFVLIARRAFRLWIARQKLGGTLRYRTAIVGTNAESHRLIEILRVPGSGFVPVGYVALSESAATSNRLPVLGTLDSLNDAITAHAIECVFVASTSVGLDDIARISKIARLRRVELRISANLPEILTTRLSVQSVGGLMALCLRPPELTGTQAFLKRAFDLVVGGAIALVALPVVGAVALAIRLTSPGPILFRQERITTGGKPFLMYKFRTMRDDADRVVDERGIDTSVPFFKLGDDDPRLTPIGKHLRRFSLDELPQLINVLKGEMSLVGPRPLPADQVGANPELLAPRHEVPAGLTGWWQIRGRSNLNHEEAVRLDLFYIENWSLMLDLYILLKTGGVVLARRGAR